MDEDSQGYLDARVASVWPWRDNKSSKKWLGLIKWFDR